MSGVVEHVADGLFDRDFRNDPRIVFRRNEGCLELDLRMSGRPLIEQAVHERREPHRSRAFATRRVDAAGNSVQAAVDDANLLHHHPKLGLVLGVGRRLVELFDEQRERRQRRVELVRRAGCERAELDDLLIAQSGLAHRRELTIAAPHECGHAADEQHDQRSRYDEVHPHAGDVQVEVAAESAVHRR